MNLPDHVDVMFGVSRSQRNDYRLCIRYDGQVVHGKSVYPTESAARDALADLMDLTVHIIYAITGEGPETTGRLDN